MVESPALANQVQPAEYHSVNGSTGLRYNTPYTVDHKIFDGYTTSARAAYRRPR